MSEKMTSGEIAKKAGVSQKAVRLYDEKGLLKPSGYSEGSYRLYDKEALNVLEKILALKKVGFSLEEIRDRLNSPDEQDIEQVLREQVCLMEEKKYQISKAIKAINGILERNVGNLDWDNAAEIIRLINIDQNADERHWDALKHTGVEMDWYVRLFRSLNLKENSKVLDLGCGYSKLWRNNWKEIEVGTKIFGYDLHGTWADDFVEYISEHKNELAKDVEIDVKFYDVETEEAWSQIHLEEKYNYIIAHYIGGVLKDKEKFFDRVSQVLCDDGMFSFNGAYVKDWHGWLKNILDELGCEGCFIEDLTNQEITQRDELIALLSKYFGKVESVLLPNSWHYNDAEDLFSKILSIYPLHEKLLRKVEKELKEFFAEKIAKEGEIVVEIRSQFWHCYL